MQHSAGLLNLAGAAILGMTLLYIAFSLPLPSIEKNVRLSATAILLAIKAKRVPFRNVILRAIPFMLLALAPAVWYVFARNHSAIHYWFTNKACIVTALAGMCGLLYAINADKNIDKNVQINNNETEEL